MTSEEIEYYSLTTRVSWLFAVRFSSVMSWDLFARIYDVATRPVSGIRYRVVSFVDPAIGSKVLDVGTGTGGQAFAFAKRGCEVVGIDLSEAMIRIAKNKNKYGNLKFQVADATSLPFESDTFDISCASLALHHMPLVIIEKALKEMVRVTKPAGSIIIIDYARPENRVIRLLVLRIGNIYEGEYFRRFMELDLGDLLRRHGVEVKETLPLVGGAIRIVKGTTIER